jgi:hypothetical protein
MPYAEDTKVPVERSHAEIETLFRRYGADSFAERDARIQFRAKGRAIRFVLLLPDPADQQFTRHPRYSWKIRSTEAARQAYE